MAVCFKPIRDEKGNIDENRLKNAGAEEEDSTSPPENSKPSTTKIKTFAEKTKIKKK
jgi:hypothetical protein